MGLSQGPCAYLVYTFALEGSGTKVVRIPCVCVFILGFQSTAYKPPQFLWGLAGRIWTFWIYKSPFHCQLYN